MVRNIHIPHTVLGTCFALLLFGVVSIPHAHALTLDLDGIFRGASGSRVTVVADTSTTNTTNATANTQSAANTTVSATADTAGQLKEFTLDSLAWSVSQSLLNQLTADMVNWINSGFQGEPAFVKNLDSYLLDIGDEVAGEFIYGAGLDFLCEPIQFQVKAALLIQYTQSGRGDRDYTPQCTLSDVVDNLENFLAGDFGAGGSRGLFELTVGTNNDPTAAYYEAQIELYAQIGDAEDREEQQLAWSGGILSNVACSFIEQSSGFSRKECESQTPGSLISAALSFQVGELPSLRLLQADELNEIIGALAAQLTNQAIGGTGGLLGLGGNDRYSRNEFGEGGNQSYTSTLRNEDTGGSSIDASAVDEAIDTGEEYLEIQKNILEDIGNIDDTIAQYEAEYPSCFSVDGELLEGMETQRETAEEQLGVAVDTLDALQTIKEGIEAEGATVAEKSYLYRLYSQLLTKGAVKSRGEMTQINNAYNIVFKNLIRLLEDAIDNEVRQCR